MDARKSALDILEKTSRTFFIPISRLPDGLLEAVSSAYLCMRAIDEIEDRPDLGNDVKARLLRQVSLNLQAAAEGTTASDFELGLASYGEVLPEVSLRLGEWALLAPADVAPRIWDATAAMADRMAHWADVNWTIHTKADLDSYTFSVAGAVGLLLSDLWQWHDGTKTDRSLALGFGRGLQSVNILRNYKEDSGRGVDFFPDNWSVKHMQDYARHNLSLADRYTEALPIGPTLNFCRIPLALAHATLDALERGEEKLTRSAVMALVKEVTLGAFRRRTVG
ncbi:squalene/phytoene synthase family protein [Synechococcus sp. PCC 7336]|uniref:squalene/phytoene synthase family protein n=1 Tax=Synechococcus sp. PCC 7336 TaxID=195250 RepID=UPI00034AABBB|nr:phytoene/squalene synthase family protein [Synechococcus sp. PCC 7336]